MRITTWICIVYLLFPWSPAIGEDNSKLILDYLEELRIAEAAERVMAVENKENIDVPLRSRRKEIIEKFASGEDLSDDRILYQELGITGVDSSTVINVLSYLWEGKRHGKRYSDYTAFFGLLRNDYQPAWEEIELQCNSDAREIGNALRALKYVDSKDSVRIAGSFLYNEEKPGRSLEVFQANPICNHAVSTLSHLAPVGSPTEQKQLGYIREEDVELWRNWWEANKHRYTPASESVAIGTTGASSNTEKAAQITEELIPPAPVEETSGASKQSSNWWLWLVGLVAVAAATAWLLRRKK